MKIIHANIYGADRAFHQGSLDIADGLIRSVDVAPFSDTGKETVTGLDEEVLDAEGAYAIPGLIDLHFHGCMGADVCDGTPEALRTIAAYEAREGMTAICPATMTLPADTLKQILKNMDEYRKGEGAPDEADLVGVNMEGPFISRVKKGAQDEQYILPCSSRLCEEFIEASGGLLKFMGLAPEDNPDFEEFIREMKDRVDISLAHTNADYDTAMRAFSAGANHAVHLYNAMPSFLHRAPGVIGAVADSPHVYAELICDGIHVHPSVVRATFAMLGAKRIVLISDSIRATGMGDGIWSLGGQDVKVEGNLAKLVHGDAIAGSATNLADCMRIAVQQMGIPLETAIACATINPARSLGIDGMYGSLEPGKKGHAVLLREDLSLMAVVKDGKVIRRA